MNIDIRKSVVDNFQDSDIEDIKVPGLGVFFEILWNNSNNDEKDFILKVLKKGLS